MRRTLFAALAVLTLTGLTTRAASAQEPIEVTPPLEIGAPAPDFEIPGATRFGVLAEPVRLSEFSGKTVVLAFFFRARTRG